MSGDQLRIEVRDVKRNVDVFKCEDVFECALVVPHRSERARTILPGMLSTGELTLGLANEAETTEKRLLRFSDDELLAELSRRIKRC